MLTPTGSIICGAKNASVDVEVGVGVNVIVGKDVAVDNNVGVIVGLAFSVGGFGVGVFVFVVSESAISTPALSSSLIG